jgi:hypothetical protein
MKKGKNPFPNFGTDCMQSVLKMLISGGESVCDDLGKKKGKKRK